MRADSIDLKPSVARSTRTPLLATILILLGSAALIFTHLGTYALWDDESLTAMTARSVWRTGDTSAWVDDHNLLAYRNGLLIKGFADRYSPPLQFYFLAPFIGLFGQSTFVCRLPFAMCGMLTIGLILRWMWRAKPPSLVWWASVIIILTDVSFFLFNRQCRYYALACLFTTAVAYCYYKWSVRRESLIPLVLVLIGLLVSHYLNYAGVVGCLIIDYLIWGRHRRALGRWDWVGLILPQVIVAAVVLSIWNPAARSAIVAAAGRGSSLGAAEYASTVRPFASLAWCKDYLIILWWNCRDLFASDFVIIPLLLLCPALYLARKNTWLLRAPLALFVFLAITAMLTTHPVTEDGDAEVRYFAPLLPVGIGIAILAVWAIDSLKLKFKITALSLTALAVCTSPAIRFYHELLQPQQEPYTPVAAWINSNMPAGASVYIQPAYMTYPLMFHAGKVLYAWQLLSPLKPEYAHVDKALIADRDPPEYLIAFGPFIKLMDRTQAELAARGIHYKQVDTVHVFWRDLFRPERLWRSFETVSPQPGEEVYIYKRTDGSARLPDLTTTAAN